MSSSTQSTIAHWPALVLTAGLATRLRPLSDVRAKAALPVAGTFQLRNQHRFFKF